MCLRRFISIVVIIAFQWSNLIHASGGGVHNNNYCLSIDTQKEFGKVIRLADALETPLATYKINKDLGFRNLGQLVQNRERVKERLLKLIDKGSVNIKKEDLENAYSLIFGDGAYYYFNNKGYFFRIRNKDFDDTFYIAFLKDRADLIMDELSINGDIIDVFRVSGLNLTGINRCLRELYGDTIDELAEVSEYEDYANIKKGANVSLMKIEEELARYPRTSITEYPEMLKFFKEAIDYWEEPEVQGRVNKQIVKIFKKAPEYKDTIANWLRDKLENNKVFIFEKESFALVSIFRTVMRCQFLHVDRKGNVYIPKKLIEILMKPEDLESGLKPYLGDEQYNEIYGSKSHLALFLKKQFWGAIGHEATEGILRDILVDEFDEEVAHNFANSIEEIPAGKYDIDKEIDKESWFDITSKFLLLKELGIRPSINIFNILRDHAITKVDPLGFGYNKHEIDLLAKPDITPLLEKEFSGSISSGDIYSLISKDGVVAAIAKENPELPKPVVKTIGFAKTVEDKEDLDALGNKITEILTAGGEIISTGEHYPTWKEVPQGELYLPRYAKLYPLVLEFMTHYGGKNDFAKYAETLKKLQISVGDTWSLYRRKYFYIDYSNEKVIINKEFLDFLMHSGYKKILMALFASVALRYDKGVDEPEKEELEIVKRIAGKSFFNETRLDDAKRLFDLRNRIRGNDNSEGVSERYFLTEDDVRLVIADCLHRGRVLDNHRLRLVLKRGYGYYGIRDYSRDRLQGILDKFAEENYDKVEVSSVDVEGLNGVKEKGKIYSFKREFQRDPIFNNRWCVLDAEVGRQDEVGFGGKAAHTGEMMNVPHIVTLRNFFTTPEAFHDLFDYNAKDVFTKTIEDNIKAIDNFLKETEDNLYVSSEEITDKLAAKLRKFRILIDETRKEMTIREQIEGVRTVLDSIISDRQLKELLKYAKVLEDKGKLDTPSDGLNKEFYEELESYGMKINRKSRTRVGKIIEDRIDFLKTCLFSENNLRDYFDKIGKKTQSQIATIDDRNKKGEIDNEQHAFLKAIYLDRYAGVMLQAFRNAVVPKDLREEIKSYLRKLAKILGVDVSELCIAVRSSAAGEDSEQASFAGRQDTYLFVTPLPTKEDPEGLDAIVDAWVFNQASLFNMRAIAYRLGKNLKIFDPKIEISTLFQVMFLSELAWIGFSVNKQGEPGIFMEVGEGQGEMLVAGGGVPTIYFMNKDGVIRMRKRGERKSMIVETPDGKAKMRMEIPSYRRKEFAITSEYIVRRVSDYMSFLHEFYGIYVDLEGAIRIKRDKGGNVIWLRDSEGRILRDERNKPIPDLTIVSTQARPETRFNLEDQNIIRLRRTVVTESAFEKAMKEVRVLDFDFVAKTGGTAKGEIVKILTKKPEDLARSTGKIMLAWQSDPDMNDAMIASKGIVAVRGGPNSHTMIVASEFGLIAITGTKDQLMDVLFDGDEVTIDAERGKILLGIDHDTEIIGDDFDASELPNFGYSGDGNIRMGTIAASAGKIFSQKPLRNWNSYSGIGLMRLELLLKEIEIIPEALLDYDNMLRKERDERLTEEEERTVLNRKKDAKLIKDIELILFQDIDVDQVISYANYLSRKSAKWKPIPVHEGLLELASRIENEGLKNELVAWIKGVYEKGEPGFVLPPPEDISKEDEEILNEIQFLSGETLFCILDETRDKVFIQEMEGKRPEGITDEDIIAYATFLYGARVSENIDVLANESGLELIKRLNTAYIGPNPGEARYISILSEGIQNAADELIPDWEEVLPKCQEIEERGVRAAVLGITETYYKRGLGHKVYFENLKGILKRKDVGESDKRIIKELIDLLDKTLYVRTDDRKSDEYKAVKGSEKYIKQERNPMKGWRGLELMLDNERTFRLQLRAIKKVADRRCNKLGVFVPIARRPEDILRFLIIMNEEGLTRDLVERGMMTELPINALRIDEFLNLINYLVIMRLFEDVFEKDVKDRETLSTFAKELAYIIVKVIWPSATPISCYDKIMANVEGGGKDILYLLGRYKEKVEIEPARLIQFCAKTAQAVAGGIDFTSTGGNDGLQTVYCIDRQTGRPELKGAANDYSLAVLRWNAEITNGRDRNAKSRKKRGLKPQKCGYCGNAPSVRGQENYGRILKELRYNSVSVVLEAVNKTAQNMVDSKLGIPKEAKDAKKYKIEKNCEANPELIDYTQYNIADFRLKGLSMDGNSIHYQLLLDYDNKKLWSDKKMKELLEAKDEIGEKIKNMKEEIGEEKKKGPDADKNLIKFKAKELGNLEKDLKEIEYNLESIRLRYLVQLLITKNGIDLNASDAGRQLYIKLLKEKLRDLAKKANSKGKMLVVGTADEPSDILRRFEGGLRYTEEEANPDYGYSGLVKQVNTDKEIFRWDLQAIMESRQEGYNIALTFRMVRNIEEIDKALEILEKAGLISKPRPYNERGKEPDQKDIMLGVDIISPSNVFEINEILDPSRRIGFVSVPDRGLLASMMIGAELNNINKANLVKEKDKVDATKDAIVILATAVEKHKKEFHVEGGKEFLDEAGIFFTAEGTQEVESHLLPRYLYTAFKQALINSDRLPDWTKENVSKKIVKISYVDDNGIIHVAEGGENKIAVEIMAETLSEILSKKSNRRISITAQEVIDILRLHEQLHKNIMDKKVDFSVLREKLIEYLKDIKDDWIKEKGLECILGLGTTAEQKLNYLLCGFTRNYHYLPRHEYPQYHNISDENCDLPVSIQLKLLRELCVHQMMEFRYFNQSVNLLPIKYIDSEKDRKSLGNLLKPRGMDIINKFTYESDITTIDITALLLWYFDIEYLTSMHKEIFGENIEIRKGKVDIRKLHPTHITDIYPVERVKVRIREIKENRMPPLTVWEDIDGYQYILNGNGRAGVAYGLGVYNLDAIVIKATGKVDFNPIDLGYELGDIRKLWVPNLHINMPLGLEAADHRIAYSAIGEIPYPERLAADNEGRIYTLNLWNELFMLTPTIESGKYEKVRLKSVQEVIEKELNSKHVIYEGLIVDNDNVYILVELLGDKHIYVLSKDGDKIKVINNIKADIKDIGCVDANGRIYCPAKNNEVIIIDKNGSISSRIRNENLSNPCGVAVDNKEMVYVLNWESNKKIIVLDSDGRLVTEVGNKGVIESPIENPRFIGLTRDGNNLVLANRGGEIAALYRDGRPDNSKVERGVISTGVSRIEGITVDNRGNIIFSDHNKNKIHLIPDLFSNVKKGPITKRMTSDKEIDIWEAEISSKGELVNSKVLNEELYNAGVKDNLELLKRKLNYIRKKAEKAGEGIFGAVDILRIVDNIKPTGKEKIGGCPMIKEENGKRVLLLDKDAFENKNKLYLVLKHEFRKGLLTLVEPKDKALRELTSIYLTVKDALGEGITDIGDVSSLDPDNQFLKIVEFLKGKGDEEMIAVIIEFMRNMPYYGELFKQFNFSGNWEKRILNEINEGTKRYDAALKIFNEIAEAKEVVKKVEIAETVLNKVVLKINMIVSQLSVKEIGLIETLLRENKYIRLDIDELEGNQKLLKWIKYLLKGKEDSPFIYYSESNRDVAGFITKNGLKGKLDSEVKRTYENTITLIEPEKVTKDMPQDTLYLPLPYARSTVYLAFEVISAGGVIKDVEPLARNTIKSLYEALLGAEISDTELERLFKEPWNVLPPITKITETLNAIRTAIANIELAASA